MAFGLSAAAIASIAGAGVAAYGAVSSADAARRNSNMAKDAADAQEQQFNKLNGKSPDIDAANSQNQLDAKAGPSGTLLTGPAGVDPSKLLLGRASLLGS